MKNESQNNVKLDLTKYPVWTKVKNRKGQSGWICLIKQDDDGNFIDNYPVVVEIEIEDGIMPYSCRKDGVCYMCNIDFDIVEVIEEIEGVGELVTPINQEDAQEAAKSAIDRWEATCILPFEPSAPEYILTIIDLDGQAEVITTCVEPEVLLDNHLLHYTKYVGHPDETEVYLSLDEIKQFRISRSH